MSVTAHMETPEVETVGTRILGGRGDNTLRKESKAL
jgi:hypothetical protein